MKTMIDGLCTTVLAWHESHRNLHQAACRQNAEFHQFCSSKLIFQVKHFKINLTILTEFCTSCKKFSAVIVNLGLLCSSMWSESCRTARCGIKMVMPSRMRLVPSSPPQGAEQATEQGAEPQFPVLEGLSDQTSGVWASWENKSEANMQPVFGVQRNIAELSRFAEQLPIVIRSLDGTPNARPDESLVEWYIEDQPLGVDLTLVLAVLGRDLQLLDITGHVALEGT